MAWREYGSDRKVFSIECVRTALTVKDMKTVVQHSRKVIFFFSLHCDFCFVLNDVHIIHPKGLYNGN